MWGIVRWIIASITLAVVTQVAQKNPRLGAFILTLPILSIIAIVLQWQQSQDLATTSKFARETLVLVPLGLPSFRVSLAKVYQLKEELCGPTLRK
jgi:predicted ABC-type exoprotein transport system permease subunit